MFYMLAVVLIIFFLATAIRILREYERGVIFRLGRVIETKAPGLMIVFSSLCTKVLCKLFKGVEKYMLLRDGQCLNKSIINNLNYYHAQKQQDSTML